MPRLKNRIGTIVPVAGPYKAARIMTLNGVSLQPGDPIDTEGLSAKRIAQLLSGRYIVGAEEQIGTLTNSVLQRRMIHKAFLHHRHAEKRRALEAVEGAETNPPGDDTNPPAGDTNPPGDETNPPGDETVTVIDMANPTGDPTAGATETSSGPLTEVITVPTPVGDAPVITVPAPVNGAEVVTMPTPAGGGVSENPGPVQPEVVTMPTVTGGKAPETVTKPAAKPGKGGKKGAAS